MINGIKIMDSTIVIPITFWSNSQPTFRISSICTTPDSKQLVTGSYSGQLCLWDLDLKTLKVTPRTILIGHEHSITSVVSTNTYVISSCEGGKISRWTLDDGYCSKKSQTLYIHRNMRLHKPSEKEDELLFTCGDYSEIFILQPFTLQVIFILCSSSDSNWISNFYVINQNKSFEVTGITVQGGIKLWQNVDLLSDSQNTVQVNYLEVHDIVDFKHQDNEVLIVSAKYWTLWNDKFTESLCKFEAQNGDRFLGGSFCDSNIVVWTNCQKLYYYTVADKKCQLISVICNSQSTFSFFDPAFCTITCENFSFVFVGDSQSFINIWKLSHEKNEVQHTASVSLKEKWASEYSFFHTFIQHSSVTCCIYILKLDKFFAGCLDGTINIIPATQSVTSFYFPTVVKRPEVDCLFGHHGKVNCLLYPNEVYSHFDKTYLVSGGSDFSVCLWDISKSELLHKFCVQGGEILNLIVPPDNCNTHIKYSVCSISSDHSVAVLNLKDKRCIILTSRHEFPVLTVHWKPLDDFIIIECYDGTVYVWQTETGHLDRVLDGVVAQEVLYACVEPMSVSTWNFYVDEYALKTKSMKKKVYYGEDPLKVQSKSFSLKSFLTSEKSESHMFSCNLDSIIAQMSLTEQKQEILDCAITQKIYSLTQALDLQKKPSTLLEKIKQETDNFHDKFQNQRNHKVNCISENNVDHSERCSGRNSNLFFNETIAKMIQFFVSLLHIWGLDPKIDEIATVNLGLLKPEVPLSIGITSSCGAHSLFFPQYSNSKQKNSCFIASSCLAMITLGRILESISTSSVIDERSHLRDCWNKFCSFYELLYVNPKKELKVARPKIEILAEAWSTKCLVFQTLIQKLFSNYLQALDPQELVDLLDFWYKYLPHFKIYDKTSSEKVDFENLKLKTVALVLFGTVGSDLKFKANDSECQENYIYQTCASFVYLILLPNNQKTHFSALQSLAVDFLGRGYIVWEQFLKIEKIIPILFKMCANRDNNDDRCSRAREALKSIAIARTAAFINCLVNEINVLRSGSPHPNRTDHFPMDQSKPDILCILIFLLEKTPYIMLLYLNEVISVFVFCIDFTHLKLHNLSNLVPVMKKFRQIDHSVISQRIAVGLGTGSIIVHDLKTGKTHEISAHKDSVSALKFSEDGKCLVSYSCYENRISFWQVLTGIFGLGHVHVKCIKSCQTYQIHDEEIRNHLEIASLSWIDKKSVMLSLCDGTESIFQI